MTWQPIETAPYEQNVLTFWPGSYMRNPVIIINSRNGGAMLGKRDGWWHSKPDETPTHWMPLPGPPSAALEPSPDVAALVEAAEDALMFLESDCGDSAAPERSKLRAALAAYKGDGE